jgi:hypothetical protein
LLFATVKPYGGVTKSNLSICLSVERIKRTEVSETFKTLKTSSTLCEFEFEYELDPRRLLFCYTHTHTHTHV